MTIFRLAALTGALALAVWLAATNPTMDDYLRFLDVRLSAALNRMEATASDRERTLIRNIFHLRSRQLMESLVRPATKRSNWGLWSVYRTTVMDQEIVVFAAGGWFLPLRGIDEASIKIGRQMF